jgi:threonine/homoserine/homoserine lactone efflux protein
MVEALLAFALTSFLIELTPGPNMAWLAIVAATRGRLPGFAAVAGVALGLAVVGALSALGLAAVLSASPTLYHILRWAGIGWLLWLALDAWREAGAPPDLNAPDWQLGRYFRRGLVVNLLNPKAAVFYISVLPTFIIAAAPPLPQVLSLSAIYVTVATAVHAGIVVLAGSAAGLLTDERRSRILRRALALALAAVAVWFAIKTA